MGINRCVSGFRCSVTVTDMMVMIRTWTLVLCLIGASAQAAQPVPSEETPPSFVPVFVGGQEGYACYRIPSMVTTKHGALIAVADGRISGCSDIPNPLDLVSHRSL